MGIIKTGVTLTKTIRNVGRLKEIAATFAKHGFAEFVSTSGISSIIPDFALPKSEMRSKEQLVAAEGEDWSEVVGFRLRRCFEELGPVFIKFGQLLSSRSDIFGPAFINEMKLLTENAKEVPVEEIEESLKRTFGDKQSEIFRSIDDKAIGTASIASVYRAVLKDGDEVVLKIRRPNIEKIVETDLAIMAFFVEQLEKFSDEIKFLGVSRLIHDFEVSIRNELNFNIEALNCERVREDLSRHDDQKIFYIPKVYHEYTCEEVLVIEYIKGVSFSRLDQAAKSDPELKEAFEEGTKIFIRSFLEDGFFHADLHGGNFFLKDNGQIALIDFGLIGILCKKTRVSFIAIIYAMLTHNYENLVYEFLDVADYEDVPDVDRVVADMRTMLAPFVGMSVKQMDFTLMLHNMVGIFLKHKIYLPREWFLVFRALITMDGVGKSLGFDIHIFHLLQNDIKDVISRSVSKDQLIEEGIWASRDAFSALRTLPRHLKWYFKELAKNNYAFEIISRGYQKELSAISASLVFLGFTLFAGMLIFSGTWFVIKHEPQTLQQVPIYSWIFWGIGVLVFCVALLPLVQTYWNMFFSKDK